MSESHSIKGVATMRFSESPHSIQILRSSYMNGNGGETVSRNFYLRKEQDEMLARLAKQNGETKVTILRAIIDEWREMKLETRG